MWKKLCVFLLSVCLPGERGSDRERKFRKTSCDLGRHKSGWLETNNCTRTTQGTVDEEQYSSCVDTGQWYLINTLNFSALHSEPLLCSTTACKHHSAYFSALHSYTLLTWNQARASPLRVVNRVQNKLSCPSTLQAAAAFGAQYFINEWGLTVQAAFSCLALSQATIKRPWLEIGMI